MQRYMEFRGARLGSSPEVVDRRLRASDLPNPTTNRDADRAMMETINARHRALVALHGFGDATDASADVTAVTTGGASAAGFELGSTGDVGKAVLVGIAVTVGASLALRFIDKMWGKR